MTLIPGGTHAKLDYITVTLSFRARLMKDFELLKTFIDYHKTNLEDESVC